AASLNMPPDVKATGELYHREHVLTSDWGVEGRKHVGAEGYADALGELNVAWQDWRQEVDELIDAGGETVVALLRLKAVGRESGAPVDQPWAMVITIRDGRVVESRTFLDRERALAAAGLGA